MGSERIALRFRDTTPDVDTIDKHQELIRRQGAVWWGWWRKNSESDHRALLESLCKSSAQGSLFIIDRSTKRLFIAAYFKVSVRGDDVDDGRIPEYYRGQKNLVAAWFLLKYITAVPQYDERLGERIGDATLLDLRDPEVKRHLSVSRETSRSFILHLSDLHFGQDYGFLRDEGTAAVGETRTTLTKSLMADLGRVDAADDVGLVLVTGDLTTKGDWSDQTRANILGEFTALTNALGLSNQDIVCLPGNHDIVRYSENSSTDVVVSSVNNQMSMRHEREYRTFLEELTGRPWRSPLNYLHRVQFAERCVTICVLNSCTITATQWTEYGYVGTSGLDVLRQLSMENEPSSSLKIVALHHHVVPVASIEAPNAKGVSLTLDAMSLLDAALDNGVHMVIHGHQHQARLTTYGRVAMNGQRQTKSVIVVSGGSTGALRLPASERNTYSLIRPSPNDVGLMIRELRPDARLGAVLYDGRLPM